MERFEDNFPELENKIWDMADNYGEGVLIGDIEKYCFSQKKVKLIIENKIRKLAFKLQNIEDHFENSEKSDQPFMIEEIRIIKYCIVKLNEIKKELGVCK